MFRCVETPPEPSFPPSPITYSASNQPLIGDTGAPFAYFHTNNARTNDRRKEAFHTAMRGEMKLKLSEFGITEHYITAENTLSAAKPAGKHIPVLMNAVSAVQTSRDVIIVVGESSQDCGVFAWRLVRGEDALKRGTAVGLAGAVKEFGQGLKEEDGNNGVPALIFINPGQLYYSFREKKAKTLVSWNDGERGSKGQEYPDEIDVENKLEGHTTAGEHVNTFIETILPGMINNQTRIYFIAIGDGAQHVLAALDKRIADKTIPPHLSRQIEAVALICPQITTHKSELDPKLLIHLATEAKSWVLSKEPLGELLAVPHDPARIDPNSLGDRLEEHPTIELDELGYRSEDSFIEVKKVESNDISMEEGEMVEDESEEQEVWEGEPPLTPTFSAGQVKDGIIETAFDCCMQKVLEFLWMRREQQVEHERFRRKFERLTFVQERRYEYDSDASGA